MLTGPTTITYDEVAALISAAVGRRVAHIRMSPEELAARHCSRGLAAGAAQILAGMDVMIAGGIEDRTTREVETIAGVSPVSFDVFCTRNARAWAPDQTSPGRG